MRRMERGACFRPTSSGCRNSVSASNVFSARTCATSSGIIICSISSSGPRHFVYAAALEMHPLDSRDRVDELKTAHGVGYCNITKCCTKVCPENITITDNAIIPLKERVIDRLYDPVVKLLRMFRA